MPCRRIAATSATATTTVTAAVTPPAATAATAAATAATAAATTTHGSIPCSNLRALPRVLPVLICSEVLRGNVRGRSSRD
jgi:hypothetical protein